MQALDNAMAALESLDDGDFLNGGGAFLEKAFNEIEVAQFAAFRLANVRDNRTRSGNRTPGGPVSRTMSTKKPRKPSAYQKWAKTERKKIVKEHPRFSFGRINQELGKRWKREKRRRGMK